MSAKSSVSPAQHPKGALNVRNSAEYIGLARGTLDNMRWRGEGPPFVRIGSRIVYRVEDLDAYLAAHVVGGDA